jgi:hypothetical protein
VEEKVEEQSSVEVQEVQEVVEVEHMEEFQEEQEIHHQLVHHKEIQVDTGGFPLIL